jgi:hypothetical protein
MRILVAAKLDRGWLGPDTPRHPIAGSLDQTLRLRESRFRHSRTSGRLPRSEVVIGWFAERYGESCRTRTCLRWGHGSPQQDGQQSDSERDGWHPICCCLEVITVNRCPRCDNENSPGHRFCGMCGDPLPTVEERARPASSPITTPPASVAGPSFLGLAEPASGGYLLEDEPRRGRGLLYLAFAVLLATGAIFAWRWRAEGYAGRALMASRELLGDADHRTGTDAGAPSVGEQGTNSSTAFSNKPNDESQQLSPDHSTDAGTVAPVESATAEKQAVTQASPPEPAKSNPAERLELSRSAQREEKWVAEGKNYLYGTGVPMNCDRARTRLFIAAEQDNPDAESVLGTMFATGHCVAVDLPTAYRWLSRAQRQNPANAKVAETLRIVWHEMPPEQQQALARGLQ